MSGYKEDEIRKICKKCYLYKGDCLMKCPYNTILNEKVSICEAREYYPTDNIPLIWFCGMVMLGLFVLSVICSYLFSKRISNSIK